MLRDPIDQAFVLLADDDARALSDLRTALGAEGAQVITCRRAALAIEAIDFHRPSAIVLDPSFDEGRGWEVLRASVQQGRPPLLALDRERDGAIRRAAFAAGADDVVDKPVDAPDVASRVAALIRRARPETRNGPVYRHNGLVVDVAAHEVRRDGQLVRVTAQQFAILCALLEAGGATLARSNLLARIESLDDEPPSDRAIDLHVSRLRRRLGEDPAAPRFITAVYGVGYRLAPALAARAELGRSAEDVLEILPDPLLVVGRDLLVRYANPALGGLLGRDARTLVGSSCGALLECRSCNERTLQGPSCFGRAVLGGNGALRDAPGSVATGDGRVDVTFSYDTLRADDDALLLIALRPRSGSPEH